MVLVADGLLLIFSCFPGGCLVPWHGWCAAWFRGDLDEVLFPQDVPKIIFIDADQVPFFAVGTWDAVC